MKKPPSRIRYEKSHPVVSARLSMAYNKKLKKILKTEKKSFAQLLREIIDEAEGEYMKTYDLGYSDGAEDSQIWYYCSICGQRIHITPNSESHKALIEYMQEHRWGHASCHEEARKRSAESW